LRAVRFEASGTENSATIGHYDINPKRSNVTGALSLIGHVTPMLNVIGSVVKGYRAPNLDDLSFSSPKPGFFYIPNPTLSSEKVLSIETGLKYESKRFQAQAFYYRNAFTDYIVPTRTTRNGLEFFDTNGNGKKDPEDGFIVQNQNVGKATIKGVEAELSYSLSDLSFYATYSRLVGTDEIAKAPLTLMPPASGSFGARYVSSSGNRPWAEIGMRFAQEQNRLSATDRTNPYIGPNGSDAYRVLDVRAGLILLERVKLSLAVENVTDEKYHFIASNRYQPGRQLVIGTQFDF
jgi:hemoglobin/transferrin/lactoferrin receptor protein